MALAVENKLKLHYVGVTTAYLHSPLEKDVYMEQPSIFEEKNASCMFAN